MSTELNDLGSLPSFDQSGYESAATKRVKVQKIFEKLSNICIANLLNDSGKKLLFTSAHRLALKRRVEMSNNSFFVATNSRGKNRH